MRSEEDRGERARTVRLWAKSGAKSIGRVATQSRGMVSGIALCRCPSRPEPRGPFEGSVLERALLVTVRAWEAPKPRLFETKAPSFETTTDGSYPRVLGRPIAQMETWPLLVPCYAVMVRGTELTTHPPKHASAHTR